MDVTRIKLLWILSVMVLCDTNSIKQWKQTYCCEKFRMRSSNQKVIIVFQFSLCKSLSSGLISPSGYGHQTGLHFRAAAAATGAFDRTMSQSGAGRCKQGDESRFSHW